MLMFAVVGEALIDLVGQRGGQTFAAHPGDSPANVALGLARLGVPVTLTTRLGRDAFGHMITSHLEASGVVVDGGPDPTAKTSLAIATLAAGVASYDFRIEWDVAALPPLPIEIRCLHTGSLATALAPGDQAVVDLVRRERERGRVTVSYDPNVRPALLGDSERARRGIEGLVALSDVVKVSDEDLGWLYPEERIEDVAARWLATGPVLVVVTRAGAGAYALSPQLEVRRPAVPVDLVDTVGAGDSYSSGLLDGLRRADLTGGTRRDALATTDESTLASVLDRAALVAAITCSRSGADPPTLAEVDALLAASARSPRPSTAVADHSQPSGTRRIAGPTPATEGLVPMAAFSGAIFDVDGVLVNSPHELVWREAFRALMEGEWRDIRDQSRWTAESFTPAVYQQVMAGMPRMAGARAAMEHFGVPDIDARIEQYAAGKQEHVIKLIEEGRFMAFPDALRFILAVKDMGIRVAAASSSKNAKLFLERIRLDTFAAEQRSEGSAGAPSALRRLQRAPGSRPAPEDLSSRSSAMAQCNSAG
jgi:fructokinase